jgi:radical SAM protein with 4Fe4S-binding SPASM domain
MDADTLAWLFDDLAAGGTRGVTIEGGGEPTISELFTAAVDMARQRGLGVGLITNGVDYPYRDRLDALEWVRVSLDAATDQQFLKHKGRDAFEQVMANLADMARRSRDTGTVIGVGYVVTRHNQAGLEELVMRLRQMQVDYVQFRPVIDHPELAPEGGLDYLKKFETSRFAVLNEGMRENADAGNSALGCTAHSLTTVITADGSVYLCGRLNVHDDILPIGNVTTESFHDIWLGARRRGQAAMVRDPAFCRQRCPQCRLSKYNVLLHQMAQTRTVNFI